MAKTGRIRVWWFVAALILCPFVVVFVFWFVVLTQTALVAAEDCRNGNGRFLQPAESWVDVTDIEIVMPDRVIPHPVLASPWSLARAQVAVHNFVTRRNSCGFERYTGQLLEPDALYYLATEGCEEFDARSWYYGSSTGGEAEIFERRGQRDLLVLSVYSPPPRGVWLHQVRPPRMRGSQVNWEAVSLGWAQFDERTAVICAASPGTSDGVYFFTYDTSRGVPGLVYHDERMDRDHEDELGDWWEYYRRLD